MIEVFGLAIGAGATFGYYQYLERVYKKKVRQVKQCSVKFKMLQKVVSKYENLFRPVKDKNLHPLYVVSSRTSFRLQAVQDS